MGLRITLVGGGKMGRALASGLIRAGEAREEHFLVIDPSDEALRWWREELPGVACHRRWTPAVLDRAEDGGGDGAAIVVIATKPQHVQQAAREGGAVGAGGWGGKLIVSIAAGITLQQLGAWFGTERIVRAMPNTPAMVGAGATAYCCSAAVTAEDRGRVERIWGSIGIGIEVPENQMDAVTGLSGSGPAYVFAFIEALADGGVMAGLPRDTALKLAAQTVAGAAIMVSQTGVHPAVLKDAVASPAGTTIAGLAKLEHNAFRGAAIEAVVAASERSRELRQSE